MAYYPDQIQASQLRRSRVPALLVFLVQLLLFALLCTIDPVRHHIQSSRHWYVLAPVQILAQRDV